MDPEPQKYSERLGVISRDQFQAALDRFSLGRLLGAQPVEQGLFGQNVFLRTTEGEFVFRGAPHYGWLFPQGGQFHKERFYAKLIHERTSVPAPWPYLVDDRTDIFGWDYALMPRLAGLQIGRQDVRARLSQADRHGIAFALGEALGRLHALKHPQPGEYDFEKDDIRPDPRLHRERVVQTMTNWYERCRRASAATTDADIHWCNSIVEENIAALDVPFQPVLVHHDYKEGNTVALREDGSWRISGVFDLMEWYAGDPEEDLVRSTFDYGSPRSLISQFVQGYRSIASLRPGNTERFRIYMLRDCLLMWEYGQRNGVWFRPNQSFRAWAEPFMHLNSFA